MKATAERRAPHDAPIERVIASGATPEDLLRGGQAPTRLAPYTLRELYARPELLKPPRTVIPGIAYAGRVTLLSSREKLGKSSLTGQGAAALSRGAEFLSELLPVGNTLCYSLDEPLADTVRRLKQHGADEDRIRIQPERPSPEDLRREVESERTDLAVIDTLTELWSGRIESRNNNEQLAVFLRPYVRVARDTGIALVFLYHTRKAGDEYSGGVQLGAAVDLPLTLRRPSSQIDQSNVPATDYDDDPADDGKRTLRGTGRGVKVSLRLAFDGTRYALGDSPLPLRQRIVRELSLDPASGNVLTEQLRVRKQTVVDELRKMRAEGLVTTRGSARSAIYELTVIGSVPVPGHEEVLTRGELK